MTGSGICTYDGVSSVDPLEMLKCVGKVVEIRTKSCKILKGTVATVDPITESYVLTCSSPDNNVSVTVVLGHTIKSVHFIDEPPVSFNFKCSSRGPISSKNDQEIYGKKLREWLQKNMIPVEDDNGVLKVGDSLCIHPPYGSENILCSNEMVLHKILGIIDRMPSHS